MGQLALPIQLDDFAVFESFLPAKNAELFQLLQKLKIDNHVFTGIWIWGSASSGKSHLLQAVCERAVNDAIFLPIKEVINNPIPLEGLSGRKIVCIDDIVAVSKLFDALASDISTGNCNPSLSRN